jgi:AraC-like DNA-binding protein
MRVVPHGNHHLVAALPGSKSQEFGGSDRLAAWIYRYYRHSGPMPSIVLPNARLDIVFLLGDRSVEVHDGDILCRASTLAHAQLRRAVRLPEEKEIELFGISLFPWAARYLLGKTPAELDGRVVPVERLNVVESELLRRMIDGCATDADRVMMVENVLYRLLPLAGDLELLLQRIWTETWESGGLTSPARILAEAGSSERRMRDCFSGHCGMTVQQFVRLARFHAFLRRLDSGKLLSSLAAELGYCDQAHLTKDCRKYTGMAPRQLHASIARGTCPFVRL